MYQIVPFLCIFFLAGDLVESKRWLGGQRWQSELQPLCVCVRMCVHACVCARTCVCLVRKEVPRKGRKKRIEGPLPVQYRGFYSFMIGSSSSCTAWCSEIGSLASLDAPEFHAFSDIRKPISLHQALSYTSMHSRTPHAHSAIQFVSSHFILPYNKACPN